MAYGTLAADVIQSSTANTPVQFNDGNGTQIGKLARAWVNFNGVSSATIRSSFNVSSVTRNATGDYTVTFTTALPDANYASVIACAPAYGVTVNISCINVNSSLAEVAPTTTAFRFVNLSAGGGAYYDTKYASVVVFSA